MFKKILVINSLHNSASTHYPDRATKSRLPLLRKCFSVKKQNGRLNEVFLWEGGGKILKYMYKSILKLNFSDECVTFDAHMHNRGRGIKSYSDFSKNVSPSTNKVTFWCKICCSWVQEFSNAYFWNSIPGFFVWIRIFRSPVGGKRAGFTFHF